MSNLQESTGCPPSNETTSDGELLARIERGDRSALGTLYALYFRTLRSIGYAILRSESDAEDAVHDVFVKLTERSGQYNPRFGSVRSWLFAAVRHASIDCVRRGARRNGKGADVATTLYAHDAHDGTTVVRALDGHRAMLALRTLSDVQRHTIESLFLEEMSCSEVAARDDVPVGTVKSRAARAIMTLRCDLVPTEELSVESTEEAA